MSYITGLGGGATGYFTDNLGQPKLWVATETWGLPCNAGRWNGGDWAADFDAYFSGRAAQGVTVLMTDVLGLTVDGGVTDDGSTWDGVAPFTTGVDPSSGLNEPFWQRIDYMFNSALAQGITIGFTLNILYGSGAGCVLSGWTSTQFGAYGTAMGNRYGAQDNLIWLYGNDNYQGSYDTQMGAFLTGVTGTGDTHLTGVWWSAEYTSRYEADNDAVASFGVSHSQFNFCYTYVCQYWIVEYAYGEVANQGASALLPVIVGDGYFYKGTTSYGSLDRNMRQEHWWALASGARGICYESEAMWKWDSAIVPPLVTTEWYAVNNLPNIVSAYTGLPGWTRLLPATGTSLVTAGRGTRVSGSVSGGNGAKYENSFANSYVAASVTADKSLAVLYLPNATTITVDQTKLGTGYGAKWMDPVTGATSVATVGSTYDSTAKGANSAGDPDWVLILATPPYATWTVP